MSSLETLGFGPFFSQQLTEAVARLTPARIAAEHRNAYEVWDEAGVGRARLAGALRAQEETPGVGDWVLLDRPTTAGEPAVIERLLNRRTLFSRGAAGKSARTQVVAANVDLVFAVTGLDADYNLHRIERYVARIWASGAQPVVILSKADVCEDAETRRAEVSGHCPGVSVYVTSAATGDGVADVRSLIHEGVTVAFVGSSGAGKSTLINALLGEERMATREVRESDGRGVHTTTHRQLLRLPGGGVLIDTPGMRELRLTDEEGLDRVFEEITVLAAGCRFNDCRHGTEPGCAVRAAVEEGSLDPDRLDHFHQLQREAASYALRQDEHARRQAERKWGALSDEVARLRKWKGQS